MQFEYIFFALLVALLIGGALKWSGSGKKNARPSPRSTSPHKRPTKPNTTYAPSSLHDPNAVSELPSMLMGTGDPMADAALNLKYGRTAQAIYILKEAFRANPPMMDAGMKLAEVLLSTNDIKSFNKVEARFKALTHEEGPFWEALKILKSDFLGTNEDHDRSTYMDFGTTEISNLKGPIKASRPHPLGPQSRQA